MFMLAVAALTILGSCACPEVSPAMQPVPPPDIPRADMLVGAYYFPGWDGPERWYCIMASPHAQHPLLGYYQEGSPTAADWHIRWALEHGVSFFAFDYYTRDGAQMLENALDDGFLRASLLDRFRFCLNWCNHAPPGTMTAQELERFADLALARYLGHPSYLRIEGKPVVMILAGYAFVRDMGVQGAREAFARFEARCREAGLNGLYLVFCEGEITDERAVVDSFAVGVRAFCLYNYPYAGTPFTGPGVYGEASYADLVAQGERLWKHWRHVTGGRFWPTVMPGWDRRPWTRDRDLIRTGSTPELFATSLRAAREHVNPDRIVMIEAWNEWGEGSVLEPSVEHGFAYLDRVREVFCPDAGTHTDVDPASLGWPRPAWDLKLPRTDTWRFNHNAEGWTTTGAEPLRHADGAVVTTSTGRDPQLNIPPTYLPSEDYRSLYLRMRLTPPSNTATTDVAQLFWSTVERSMCEETSVAFEVALDGRWHEYRVSLDASAWLGLVDRLRLDPTSIPGVRIEVDMMRLEPGSEAG